MKHTIPESAQAADEHLITLKEREEGNTINNLKESLEKLGREQELDDLEAIEEENQRNRKETLKQSEKPYRVVQEMLQNANDVPRCGAVVFTLTPDKLIVENDGRVMTKDNVDRLCSFHRTTKSEVDSIGQFGTGFKTVFSIADKPQIDSGYYHFELHRQAPTVPSINSDVDCTDETIITLPFKENISEEDRELIEQQLMGLSGYIKYLSLVTVQVKIIKNQGQTEVLNYYKQSKDSKRVIKKECDNQYEKSKIRKDFSESTIINGQREKVTISIPISNESPKPSRDNSRLYCYFPTQDYISVPFDIQADFEILEDRQHIIHYNKSERNEQIFKTVADCVREARDHFLHEYSESTAFLSLLPEAKESESSSQRKEQADIPPQIKEKILSVFRESNCIECEDCSEDSCSLHRPAEIFHINEEFHHLFSTKDYKNIFDEKRYKLSLNYPSIINERVRNLPSVHDVDITELFTACQEAGFVETKSKEWLIEFCIAAATYRESEVKDKSEFDDSLAALPVLWLSESGSPVVPKDGGDESVYFPLTKAWNLSGANYIVDELYILDREFHTKINERSNKSNSSIKELFENVLNIEQLKPKGLISRIVPHLQNPTRYSNDQHDQAIRLLYAYYRRQDGLPDIEQNLNGIKLRTQTEHYRRAEKLLLTDTYREDRQYDLDPVAEALPNVDQVNKKYSQLTESEDGDMWNSFLRELGVQTYLDITSEKNGYKHREELRESIRKGKDNKWSPFSMPDHLDVDPVEDALPPDEAVRSSGYNGQGDHDWMKRQRQGCGYKYGLIDAKLDTGNLETLRASCEDSDASAVRENLVNMIHANWNKYYSDFAYIKCAWAIDNQRGVQDIKIDSTRCPTTFIQMLRTVKSIPCKDSSYYRPREVYIDTPELKNAQVPLLDLDLNDDFQDCLGIRTELGPERLAYSLKNFARDWKDGEIDDIDQFTKNLAKLNKKMNSVAEKKSGEVQEILTGIEYPVPDRPGEIRSFERLVWRGNDLNNWLLTVRDSYGVEFQPLMKSQLNIPETVNIAQSVDYYEQLIEKYDQDENKNRFEEVQTAFSHLIESYIKQRADDRAIDLGENIDRLPALNNKLIDMNNISYYCRNRMENARVPDDQKSCVLSVSPSKIDVAAVKEIKQVYQKQFDLKIFNSVWVKSVSECEPTDGEPDTVEHYTQMLNLLYSILSEHTDCGASSIETLHKLNYEEPRWADYLTCTHRLDDEVISDNIETDCIVQVDSSSDPVVMLTADVNSVASMTTEFLSQFSIDTETYSKVIDVVDGAFGKPDELIEQYLEKRGYDFQQIPENPGNESTAGGVGSNVSDSTAGSDSSTASTGSVNKQAREDESQREQSTKPGISANGSTNISEEKSDEDDSDKNIKQNDESASTEVSPQKQPDENKSNPSPSLDKLPDNNDSDPQSRKIDPNKIGKIAESYIVRYLTDKVESYFESYGRHITTNSQMDPKWERSVVQGSIQDEKYSIKIINVGQEKRGYDICISGVTLTDAHLAVSDIDTDAKSTVEVKGSTSYTPAGFTMTKNEKQYAEDTNNQYYLVRVRNIDPETEQSASTAEIERVWQGFDALESDSKITPLSYNVKYNNG